MTRDAAWFLFEEHEPGVLEPGRLADIRVLSEDYISAPASDLPQMRSDLTMVGGEIVSSSLGD
jgi:predicted amidohydrolase YtcJ